MPDKTLLKLVGGSEVSEVKVLQDALKEIKRLQQENQELRARIDSLSASTAAVLMNPASLKPVEAPKVTEQMPAVSNMETLLFNPGSAHIPAELLICERQIQMMKARAMDQQLEWEDVRVLSSLVETKLRVLQNTLDLKKPSKKSVEKEMSDLDVLNLIKE